MRRMLRTALAVSLVTAAWPSAAQVEDTSAAPESSAATALVRVWDERSTAGERTWPPPGESTPIAAAAGTGFFVTGSGDLLTTAELVDAGGAAPVIEVVVPAPEGEGDPAVYAASLVASDPLLGVALLSIDPDGEVPSVRLGDSDAVTEGQRLSVFGRRDEEEAATSSLRLRGARADELSVTRLLELGGRLEPGSEGGAVVDREGYAVGIAKRGEGGRALGIPINLVKDFLAVHGAGGAFPANLRLGPVETFEGKGLRLRPVEGVADTWPARTRVESPEDAHGVRLRIDRLASPLELGTLEARLLAGGFEGLPAVRAGDRSREERVIRFSRTRLHGSARALRDGRPVAVEYLLARIGDERIVARYELPEDLAAYNRSVLRQSLESLRVSRLLMLSVSKPLDVTMQPTAFRTRGAPALSAPRGWRLEPVPDTLPGDLSAPAEVLAASPELDYTVSFVAYLWRRGAAPADAVRQGSAEELEVSYHGLDYRLRRVYAATEKWVLLLECRWPTQKQAFVQPACTEWQAAGVRAALGWVD